ncbi:MAG: PEP-CTERM sorting domain-containing protein [Bryobacteraceae bacterium]
MKQFTLKSGYATFIGIFFAALVLSGLANASQIYYNLGNGAAGVKPEDADYWGANAFTTDSNSYVLTNVTLALEGVSDASGTFSVSLYSASGSKPGGSLLTLGNAIADSSVSSTGYNDYSYDGEDFALTPSTMYWIVVSGTSDSSGDVSWEGALSAEITPNGEIGRVASSSNGGNTWSSHPLSGDYKPFVMEVDGDPAGGTVPEPGTALALMAGLAGLAVLRSKRRT